jgi:hypothetical protein
VNGQRQEVLLKEYGEVSNLFHTLTDLRFRLLGILPIASAVTAALGPELRAAARLVFRSRWRCSALHPQLPS